MSSFKTTQILDGQEVALFELRPKARRLEVAVFRILSNESLISTRSSEDGRHHRYVNHVQARIVLGVLDGNNGITQVCVSEHNLRGHVEALAEAWSKLRLHGNDKDRTDRKEFRAQLERLISDKLDRPRKK